MKACDTVRLRLTENDEVAAEGLKMTKMEREGSERAYLLTDHAVKGLS